MECFLRYWDELDDLVWLVAALRERFVRAGLMFAGLMTIAVAALLSVQAASVRPDLAMAFAGFLAVSLLFRPAVNRGPMA
jgi:hypothetical protein